MDQEQQLEERKHCASAHQPGQLYIDIRFRGRYGRQDEGIGDSISVGVDGHAS